MSGSAAAGVYTNIGRAAGQLWVDLIHRLQPLLTIGIVMATSITCELRYGDSMQHSDFEDAVYRRTQ